VYKLLLILLAKIFASCPSRYLIAVGQVALNEGWGDNKLILTSNMEHSDCIWPSIRLLEVVMYAIVKGFSGAAGLYGYYPLILQKHF
jgi:hypothetical protein